MATAAPVAAGTTNTYHGAPPVRGIPTAARLRSRDAGRLRRYKQYQGFYEGRHFERPRNGRTNLVLNYARAVVDKGLAYLLGRGIDWSVLPVAEEQERAKRRAMDVEQLLYDVGTDNDVDAVDQEVAQNAAVVGDGVYKVFWQAAEQRVRIVSIDPRTFFATWAGDDRSVLRRVDVVYCLGAENLAAGGYGLTPDLAQTLTGERLVDVVESWTADRLEIWVADQLTRADGNPYGFIPFVHVPNLPLPNETSGRSDLVDVLPINRELDERVSDQSDVIRFHAAPPVVFKGVSEHNDLAVGPGTVWDIPADADVMLLEWQGQGAEVGEHLDRLPRALFEVSETPRTAFGDSDGLLTGVALEIQLRPIIQKTLRRRVWWTRGLRRRAMMVLRLLDQFGGQMRGSVEAYRVRVIWPPMLPSGSLGMNVAIGRGW